MAQGEGSLDWLFAGLASIGFELEECQQAVESGHKTLEDAVEWILAKRSSLGESSSRDGQHSRDELQAEVGEMTDCTSSALVIEDKSISSRYHLSESQLKAKEDYVRKERETAQQEAKRQRVMDKRFREQLRKEIAADREATKERQRHVIPSTSSQSHSPCSSSTVTQAGNDLATIQIRLPSGEMLRERFPQTATLMHVTRTLMDIHPEIGPVQLIQPFPRREFSAHEAVSTLCDLGLTPQGTLVVRREAIEPVTEERSCCQHPERDPGLHVGEEHLEDLDMEARNPLSADIAVNMQSVYQAAQRRIQQHWQRLHQGSSCPPSQLQQAVPSLVDICICDIAHRLPGHHHAITNLCILPHGICYRLIEKLKENKTFNAKTLHAFIPCKLKRLKLDHYALVTNGLISALKPHIRLNNLSLSSCILITDSAVESLGALKMLRLLNLNDCQKLTSKICSTLKELHELESLHLRGTKVSDDGILELIEPGNMKKLTYIDVSGTLVTDKSFSTFACLPSLSVLIMENTQTCSLTHAQEVKTLEVLIIARTKITNNCLSLLHGLPKLYHLNLAGTTITEEGLEKLQGLQLTKIVLPNIRSISNEALASLKELPLAELDLTDHVGITDEGICHVGQITSLTKLSLSNTKLTDAGMAELKGLVKLKELDLDRTQLTDAGMMILLCFKCLEVLGLSATSISNATLKTGILNKLSCIRRLNLSRTRISDKGIKHLVLPNLTLLNLDWTRVSEGCRIFLKGCPSLKVLRMNNCSPSSDSDSD